MDTRRSGSVTLGIRRSKYEHRRFILIIGRAMFLDDMGTGSHAVPETNFWFERWAEANMVHFGNPARQST
jgi:hypothetical protein